MNDFEKSRSGVLKFLARWSTAFSMILGLSACGLFPMQEEAPKPKTAAAEPPRSGDDVRFSDNQNLLVTSNRQYKRMTRARMEEESELNAQAGSMWVNEGQGAYLFAQNKTRKEGDVLSIKLEGAAQKEIETKVGVIKKLLQELEAQETADKLARQKKDDPTPEAQAATPKGNAPPGTGTAARAPASTKDENAKKETDQLAVDSVPVRVLERQPDGNYRVKGQAPFMIGQREYKVIVTGLVRPEDYNDDGVSSNKVVEPMYDVVSVRKKAPEKSL